MTAHRDDQKGVALLTAMLLVAITAALAAKLIWDNQISMRRVELALAVEQSRQFAYGAEAIAIEALAEDTERGFDHYGEDWAIPVPPLPVGIDDQVLGSLQGQLYDAQSRFNINNLVRADTGQPDETARLQFANLLALLRLDPGITDAVIDWIDADTIPQGAGAEDGTYTVLDPPYRTANNFLLDISELRLIAGVDETIFATLLPHVTAIPPGWCGSATRPVPVNFNTADAVVLAAMDADNIGISQAESWVEDRGRDGWQNWNDIAGLPVDFPLRLEGYVALNSNCFDLRVIVNVGSSIFSMYSLLDRSSVNGQITSRTRIFGVD